MDFFKSVFFLSLIGMSSEKNKFQYLFVFKAIFFPFREAKREFFLILSPIKTRKLHMLTANLATKSGQIQRKVLPGDSARLTFARLKRVVHDECK